MATLRLWLGFYLGLFVLTGLLQPAGSCFQGPTSVLRVPHHESHSSRNEATLVDTEVELSEGLEEETEDDEETPQQIVRVARLWCCLRNSHSAATGEWDRVLHSVAQQRGPPRRARI